MFWVARALRIAPGAVLGAGCAGSAAEDGGLSADVVREESPQKKST